MKRLDYKNKTVVLTGASSGIGKALATELIKKYGCTVYAVARNEQRLNACKNELGENYIPYPFDASSKENWTSFVDFLQKSGTRVDILINCAGVLPKFTQAENAEICDFESAINVNYLSQVYACKELLPLINALGAIVNISSASALCPFGSVSAYTASKAASFAFSTALSCELKNIRVSAVAPGFVKTDIMKNQSMSEKEARLVNKFSADPNKVARKILRRTRRRKRRITVGFDAHLMSITYRLFPRLAPRIISAFLKKSGLNMFNS